MKTEGTITLTGKEELAAATRAFLDHKLEPKHVPDQDQMKLVFRSLERTQEHLMMMLLRIEDKLDRIGNKRSSSLLE